MWNMVQRDMIPILAPTTGESTELRQGGDRSPDTGCMEGDRACLDFWEGAMLELHSSRNGIGATHVLGNTVTDGADNTETPSNAQSRRHEDSAPVSTNGSDNARDVEIRARAAQGNSLDENVAAKTSKGRRSSSPKSLFKVWPFEDDSSKTLDDVGAKATSEGWSRTASHSSAVGPEEFHSVGTGLGASPAKGTRQEPEDDLLSTLPIKGFLNAAVSSMDVSKENFDLTPHLLTEKDIAKVSSPNPSESGAQQTDMWLPDDRCGRNQGQARDNRSNASATLWHEQVCDVHAET
jgi:hypothetical protein